MKNIFPTRQSFAKFLLISAYSGHNDKCVELNCFTALKPTSVSAKQQVTPHRIRCRINEKSEKLNEKGLYTSPLGDSLGD